MQTTTIKTLAKPPAGMDTPNMRFAIACGLLAANNDLGYAAMRDAYLPADVKPPF
jgi:hypothetical protein